ncbi:ATP-binding protein [Anaeromyxobacter sp. SG17]|uniref:ATP-binding protein n=1 Tax=Anaeromyxobacter sp. SG17 TaxID=2925405 RepID=UPI001F5A4935|nr:ferredoxin [Anaeromyxobacter sp. SG17]
MIRKIVQIDEARCDGCGQCIPSCAEGAIALVNGKARLSADVLCDGLGACLGECPQGAITVIEREAAAFDEAAVKTHLEKTGAPGHAHAHAPAHPAQPAASAPPPRPRPQLSIVSDPGPAAGAGCPGSRPRTLSPRPVPLPSRAGSGAGPAQSRLGQWPVQLHLVPVTAPYFQGADLLVAADCVPFAYAGFHDELLAGKALVVGCPKLDDNRFYAEKLTEILTCSDIRSVTVARMEVPCCGGIAMSARHAVAASGKALPLRDVVVGVDGALR